MVVETRHRLTTEGYNAPEPKWGPIGREVFNRTYARPDSDGRTETWLETVTRVVNGNIALVDPAHIEDGEAEKLRDLLYNFRAIPAGRHLWVSGVPGRQFLFNCHRAGWTERVARHYEFTFNELMKGGGVGANYSNNYIDQYPAVGNRVEIDCYIAEEYAEEDLEVLLARDLVKRTHESWVWFGMRRFDWKPVYPPPSNGELQAGDVLYRVTDTREGWYTALGLLLDTFFATQAGTPRRIFFDLSLLRPMGTIIKGFGGIASGPWALATLLKNVAAFLNSKVGQHLTSQDHMMLDHLIAQCVVAGNVRRSARMSIKVWYDENIMDFINCKSDPQHHWSTNISVEVDDEFWSAVQSKYGPPDGMSMIVWAHANAVFNAVVDGMMKNGEPGFVNTSLAAVGERGDIRSTNPCGEIFLEEWENCNLGHVNLGEFAGDFDGACDAFRLMQRYLLRATFGDITDISQREVVDRNRRTGVGIFGFQEWLNKQGVRYSDSWKPEHLEVRVSLRRFKMVCDEEATRYAEELGCNRPVKTTTAAPTGTISQGPGTTPSIQTIMHRYGNRLVRYGADDPKLQSLHAHGYLIEDDLYAANTKVVYFPYKDILVAKVEALGLSPEHLVEEACEVLVDDYLAVQAMVQKEYVDNAISLTINFIPGSRSKEEIASALRRYGPELKGTTLMPDGTRPQAPYQRLTREEYEATGVGSVSQSEMECATGACPIK